MNEVLKMKGCVCMMVKEIEKQMKMFFKHKFPPSDQW